MFRSSSMHASIFAKFDDPNFFRTTHIYKSDCGRLRICRGLLKKNLTQAIMDTIYGYFSNIQGLPFKGGVFC